MKVIVIGGYPGVGKSTIVRNVLEVLTQQGHKFIVGKHDKLVTYTASEKGVFVLGTYGSNETFPGTDRFAMNAQPEAMEFLLALKDTPPDYDGQKELTVVFEGDRLFNGKMLDFLYREKFNRVLCIVQAEQSLIEERRQARSKQNESWRKGRQTKVDKLAMNYPIDHWLYNDTQKQMEASVSELVEEINGTWAGKPPKSKIKYFWSKS